MSMNQLLLYELKTNYDDEHQSTTAWVYHIGRHNEAVLLVE